MAKITKVCVIGAGVMGSGIAAQIANSGTKVLLLDIASKEQDRSSIARSSVAKMFSAKPPPLSHPKRADFIEIGNLDDDLDKIRSCQLIIEVIIEKLEIKHSLYNKLLPYLDNKAILVSNTSTLPLSKLKENLPESVAKRFMIIHFFNPPRYMRLLELITDETTDLDVVNSASLFITHRLGKSIVRCNDTPGFIANRIGCFLLELVLRKTLDNKLAIEEVDRVLTQKLSLPSTGIFGLYDLIGIDVMDLISKSLTASLPSNDRFVQIYTEIPLTQKMIKEGYTGRKGLGGFYRIIKETKIKEVLDLESGEYRAISPEQNPKTDQISTEIVEEFEVYVRSLIPEVTDKKEDIDRAMKLGYSCKFGPFELFDKSPDTPHVTDKKSHDDAFMHNHNIFDINTKMNCLTIDAFNRLIEAVQKAESNQTPLYIYSKAPNFSAGADLKFLFQKIQDKNWQEIEDYLKLGQKAMMSVKYASAPVISCAKGVALGGGCELLLHSHYVVANQQLNAGLVEASLGLIPAFGGTKEMVLRSQGDPKLLKKLLGNIINQNKSSSADYFSESYRVPLYVNMNVDYLFEEAVKFHPLQTNVEWGDSALQNIKEPDEHIKLITKKLDIFSEKDSTEDDLLAFEREIFMELVKVPIVEEKIKKFVS